MPSHSLIQGDPLWVPLLTHYLDDRVIDQARMEVHLGRIAQDVNQIMLAGSTGDGWELDEERFQDLIDFAANRTTSRTRIMFGALAPDAEGVIARIKMVEDRLEREPGLRDRYVGATVCPPVEPQATQSHILEHYAEVMRRTTSPISVYQLPQVTGCEMTPETVRRLADEPRVIMFKDSSGADKVAASGLGFDPVVMLRGAEGGYAQAVTGGGYGGWLLSSANVFGGVLREVEALLRSGRPESAVALSDRLGVVVARLFQAAAEEGGANAFSNANRAADHLKAHGARWDAVPPPIKQDGKPLAHGLLVKAASICEEFLTLETVAYLDRESAS